MSVKNCIFVMIVFSQAYPFVLDAQVINREKALHNDETSRDVSGSLEGIYLLI